MAKRKRTEEQKARRRELEKQKYADPEYRAKYRAQQQAWREANRDAVRQSNRESMRRAPQEVKDARWLKEKERYANDPEFRARRLEIGKRYRERNPEKMKEIYLRNREYIRGFNGMVFQPGQTIDSMFAEQQGKCTICGETLPVGRHMHVDHCHKTGHVRALLCRDCNLGLGNFMDDSALLRKAADYLDAHAARIEKLERVLNSNHVALVDGRSERPPE